MTGMRIGGLVLVVAGALALGYGGFTYTKNTQAAKLGPIEIAVKEEERVNVPLWAGIGAVVLGAALFAMGGKKS